MGGTAGVSSNSSGVFPRVLRSLSGLPVVVSLFSTLLRGLRWDLGGMLGSALGPPPRRGMRPGGESPPFARARGRQHRGGCGGGGFGGGGSWRPPRPGSRPRPRRARSAVLPRSSPMLIFGLGCPCPGISRHASRRPVRRPEAGREGVREARTAAAAAAAPWLFHEPAADPPAPPLALPLPLAGHGRGAGSRAVR